MSALVGCMTCGDALGTPHPSFKGYYCEPCRDHWEEHGEWPEVEEPGAATSSVEASDTESMGPNPTPEDN